jgi:protein arginine kinase activator
MLCDECKKNEAVHNFTQISNGEMITQHLCQICAEKRGIGDEEKIKDDTLSSFMSKIGTESGKKVAGTKGVPLQCPTCKSKFSDFKKTGRLGCPDCYTAFEEELGSLLRKIHGSHIHVGRGLREGAMDTSPLEGKIRELRKRLEESVSREEFETAARLRDEIKVLEKYTEKSEA